MPRENRAQLSETANIHRTRSDPATELGTAQRHTATQASRTVPLAGKTEHLSKSKRAVDSLITQE